MSTEHSKIVKHDQMTCGSCPTQWEGQLHDGRHFYFRYRFSKASLAIGATAEEVSGRQSIAETVGDDLDGTMDLDEYRASFLRLYHRLAEDDGQTPLDFVIARGALPGALVPGHAVTAGEDDTAPTNLAEELRALVEDVRHIMATSANDWGADRAGARLYAIFFGWSDGEYDGWSDGEYDAWSQLTARHRWTPSVVEHLRQHHATIEQLLATAEQTLIGDDHA